MLIRSAWQVRQPARDHRALAFTKMAAIGDDLSPRSRVMPSMMIGITISGNAYAAIAATLPPRYGAVSPDSECLIWLPRAAVFRLLAMREPGETFSDVILRLAERGSYAAFTR